MVNNPKLIALLQTAFYGCVTVIVPMIIAAFGAGGALNGIFTPAVTGIILFALNMIDNNLNKTTGGNFFGAVQ